MGSKKERAKKAIEAMKRMGFQGSRALPVLKKLLKACENSWEHIEADNYSLLAESIFEADATEEKDKANKKRREVLEKELESDRKRPRQEHDDTDGSSPSALTASISSPRTVKSEIIDSPGMNTPVEDRFSPSYHMESCMGKDHVSASASHQQENIGHATDYPDFQGKSISNVVCQTESTRHSPMGFKMLDKSPEKYMKTEYLKEPKIEELAQLDKNERFLCQPICIEFPDLMLHPSLQVPIIEEALSSEDYDRMSYQSQNTDQDGDECSLVYTTRKRENGTSVNFERSSKTIEIASLMVGEKKISLSCNVSKATDFHMPNIESVLKRVETKCLQLHPALESNFCLMDIMKEVCKSILEMTTEKSTDDHEKPIQIVPALDSLKTSIINKSNDDYKNNADYIRKGKAIQIYPEPCTELALVSLDDPLFESDEPAHEIRDICKGEERVKIPIINDFPGDRCPSHFAYISHNTVHRKAHLNFSLAQLSDGDCCSHCFGDCLVASVPCVCARETGGEFAYTTGGLLRTEFLDECIAMRQYPSESYKVYCKDCPLERAKDDGYPKECKGHFQRKIIKECWKKCRCHKQCGNRVVQQGIWCNLQVFWTPDKGWGLRSTYDLPKGAFVCEYVGEVLTCAEFYERTAKMSRNSRHTYPIVLDANWASEEFVKDGNALCLDGSFYGNIARFINHQCFDANLVEVPVQIETADRCFYHVAFFTSREVYAYEELTWDYGVDFDEKDPLIKNFQCQCDSNRCRDKSRPAGKRRAGISIC